MNILILKAAENSPQTIPGISDCCTEIQVRPTNNSIPESIQSAAQSLNLIAVAPCCVKSVNFLASYKAHKVYLFPASTKIWTILMKCLEGKNTNYEANFTKAFVDGCKPIQKALSYIKNKLGAQGVDVDLKRWWI